MTTQPSTHRSVMIVESIEFLVVQPGQWYIDATFGGGGHSQAILDRGGNVLGVDWDEAAIQVGQQQKAKAVAAGHLRLVRDSFSKLPHLWKETGIETLPQSILFDFGTSTDQLMSGERGFSFDDDGPLDMRMDDRLSVTAAQMLNFLSLKELTTVLKDYGGEEDAQVVAKAIKAAPPIATTRELSDVICSVKRRKGKLHPATKAFQALRVVVNGELDEINVALPAAFDLLPTNGRLVTIAFHEGEDRLAKHWTKLWEERGVAQLLTKKPLKPSPEEVAANPRSRSGKLRAVSKN